MYPDVEEVSSLLPVHGLPEKPHQPVEFNFPQRTFGYHGLSNPRGTRCMQFLLDDNTSGSALMMPTRRYLKSARIVTQKHCCPHAQIT